VAVRGDESSLASASWTLTERTDAALPTGMRYFAYQLTLPYQGASYTLEAAHVRVRTHHDLAAWSASDFYVPPGLWGAGIGERFLRHIVTTGAARSGIARFLVRIPTPRNGPPAVRKESADETQLYRSCGFAELEVTDGTCLTIDQKPTAFGDVLALLGYTGAPADARWLVREGDHPRWEGALRMEDRSPAKR
jgi:GNAT superfamily N-acetyltransferase